MSEHRNHLRTLMDERRLSIRKLAAMAKVSPSTIQSLSSGQPGRVRYSTVMAIAAALGVDPHEVGNGCTVVNDGSLFADSSSSDTSRVNNYGNGAAVATSGGTAIVSCAAAKSCHGAAAERFKARSPALAPMILDGDELFVGPAESAKTNDFVIAEKEDGSEVLVRLIRNGDELWGQIDNQNLPGDKIFPIKDVKWKVIGLKRMF